MKRRFAMISSEVVVVEQSVRDEIIALGSSTGAVFINRTNESIYVDVEDIVSLYEDISQDELPFQEDFTSFVSLLANLLKFDDNESFLKSGPTILYVSVK